MLQQFPIAEPRAEARATTTAGGVQVFTSPDGRSTTITSGSRVTTITSSAPEAPVVVTVNGRPSTDARALHDAIAGVARSSRAPRESRESRESPLGFVRVNGRPLGEPQLLAAGAAIGSGATLVGMSIVFLLTLAVRRVLRRPPAPAVAAPSLAPQVGQLQHAVDAIAVEMERVSEAHRFSAKLLAERLPDTPLGAAGRVAPERVITPH